MNFEYYITGQQLVYGQAKMFAAFAAHDGKQDWRFPTGNESYEIAQYFREIDHELAGQPIWDASMQFTTDMEMIEQPWYNWNLILVRDKNVDD